MKVKGEKDENTDFLKLQQKHKRNRCLCGAIDTDTVKLDIQDQNQ